MYRVWDLSQVLREPDSGPRARTVTILAAEEKGEGGCTEDKCSSV